MRKCWPEWLLTEDRNLKSNVDFWEKMYEDFSNEVRKIEDEKFLTQLQKNLTLEEAMLQRRNKNAEDLPVDFMDLFNQVFQAK